MYPIPPPWVKTGMPNNPITIYTPTEMAPSLEPNKSPAKVVNKNCNVKGTKGMGILINAPTAISAEKRPHKIRALGLKKARVRKILCK